MTLKGILDYLWDKLVRLRTWLWNAVFLVIFTPDVILLLLGYDWSSIVPLKYMPLVVVVQAAGNAWMRPRLAARKSDK